MATITYTTEDNSIWTFNNPTITVTETPIMSAKGHKVVAVRVLYTVRSFIIATDELNLGTLRARSYRILEQSRGTFAWYEGDTCIDFADPENDVQWGPRVVSLSFPKFYSNRIAEIEWQLETVQHRGASGYGAGAPYDLVYTIATQLDQNYYSTRTITGVLQLRAGSYIALSDDFKGADCYRNQIAKDVCATPKGWQRITQNYTMSADGLALSFSVVDRQRFAVYPVDITSGDVTITGRGILGPQGISSGFSNELRLTGWFEGPTDRPNAPINAFRGLVTSVFAGFSQHKKEVILQTVVLERELYKNMVRFEMSWLFPLEVVSPQGDSTAATTTRVTEFSIALVTQANTWIQQYKGAIAFDGGVYGTTKTMGWCGSGQVAPLLQPNASEIEKGAPQQSPYEGYTYESPFSDSSKKKQLQGYTYWHHYFAYRIDFGRIFIPVMGAGQQDVAQQVRAPQIYLLTSGEASRMNSAPEVPEPPYCNASTEGASDLDSNGAYLLQAEISPSAPEPGPVYTVSWRYLLKIVNPVSDDLLTIPEQVKFPYTPLMPTVQTEGIEPNNYTLLELPNLKAHE